jgi:hypothetical protein
MRKNVTMSQPPLTMYILQPILFRPIGMMNTSASLSTHKLVSQQAHQANTFTYR